MHKCPHLLFIWMFISSLGAEKMNFFMLSFSLWDVGVWGMENGEEEKREQRVVGSLTQHILFLSLWKPVHLRSRSLPQIKAMLHVPLTLNFFLVNGYPSMFALESRSVGIFWKCRSGSAEVGEKENVSGFPCKEQEEFHDGDSGAVSQARAPQSPACWAGTQVPYTETGLAGCSLFWIGCYLLSEH